MLRTSIATVSLCGDLAEKLEAIAAAGFDGVEIFENDFLAFPPVAGGCRPDGAATPVSRSRCSSRSATSRACPSRSATRAFDRAERKFDVMQALGTDLMLVCSNVSPAALGGIDRAADDFRELGERAAERGLRIGYEALAWGRHVYDHRDAWEIVRRADHPAVGLILDCFHTLARRIDPDSIRAHPRRPDLPGAARRRAAARHGPPLLEPALPQHARTGRPRRRRLPRGGRGDRL